MGKTVLYQFENDYREIDCGMFYAIRCRDGSFFLIDSSHQNPRFSEEPGARRRKGQDRRMVFQSCASGSYR